MPFMPTEITIRKGDTLSEIAQMFDTTVSELVKLNNIENANFIRAGDTLKLPKIAGRTLNIPSRKKNTPTRTQPAKKVKESTKPVVTEEESFLPINIRQIFNPEQDRTEKDLSKEERDALKEVIARSQTPERIAEKEAAGLNPFAIEYKDYETTEKGAQYADVGGSMGLLGLFNKLQNPAYNLKTFLGQASAIPQEGGGYRIQDVYDFKPKTQKQGLSKFGEYLSSVGRAGFNPYSQVRNFMGYYGPQEGTGMGGRSDIRIMQQGGDTMDIQQQTKNVAAQGRYGDSMLLHVNPAEVKGLASAMPITVNPQTGQPEAFLPFLAPLLGGFAGSALLGAGTAAGLSTAAATGIGAGLAQTAVTGDIKEGLMAGLTAGLGSKIFSGAGDLQVGKDALTTPTTSLPIDPTTGLNYTPTAALESAVTQNIGATNPNLLNPQVAGPTVTGTSIPQTLNPLGQAELNTIMNSPIADNYLQTFSDDAIAQFGAEAGNPTNLESLGAAFRDPSGSIDIGQGFSNIGSAAMNDPMALAGLGTTGTMYGMDMMQADYEEQMARMQAEREEKRRQNMLMNPEPILYSAEGGITQFDEGGLVDNLLSGDYGMLGMLNNNPELMFGAAGVAAKNNFRGSLLGELYNQYKKKKDSGDEVGAAALQSEIQNQESMEMMAQGGRTGYFMGGDMRAAIDSVGGRNITGGELPQIFAPAKQAYAVNPDFMPGFAPETMYFNPSTISAPASGLQAGAPPIGIDTYEGSKGGYGGRQASIAPQVSIDPFAAYTGSAPKGLEFTETPMPVQPLPELPVQPILPPDFGIDPIDIGGIVGIPNIGNIDIQSIIDGLEDYDRPERFMPITGKDLGITQPSLPNFVTPFDNTIAEELPKENFMMTAAALEDMGITPQPVSGGGLGGLFGSLTPQEPIVSEMNTQVAPALDVISVPALDVLDPVVAKQVVDIPTYNYNDPARLARIDDYFASDRFASASGGSTNFQEGGALKPIPEDNKGLPNLPKDVRNEMGYMQEGGMTEMQNDPLTREVTAFLLGESNNEEALNMFLTKYGNEAFMQLREAVLQSVVPGAQTEGLIRGDGEGGMDDDLRGMIGNKERIAVSQDEFIVPADVVSMLGDGSSDAGSKELYDMMDRVRKEKTGTTKQAPRLANAGGLLPA